MVLPVCSGTAGGTDSCPSGSAFLVETKVLGTDAVTPIAPKLVTYRDKLGRAISGETEGFAGNIIRSLTEQAGDDRPRQQSDRLCP